MMEVSGETFTYNNDGQWVISALTTDTQEGEAVTSTVMRQPLGSGPLSCAAFLAHADHIVDSAFKTHDGKLGVGLDEAISYFHEMLQPGWQERGVTPLEVRALH